VPSAPKLVINPKATSYSMPIVEVARASAERGFDGLYLCEHTHIPVAHPRSASPTTGTELARWIKSLWDPYVALAFVAATTALEIGTAVALPAEHDAIALAKTLATLDELSAGRLVLGVGWGWNREEFEHHGFPASRRVDVLQDKLALMRALWTEEEASHQGTYVRMASSWSWPKPRQTGGPPVLLGVPGIARNFQRIADWGDGWIPMATPLGDPDQTVFARQVAELRATWADRGRNPDDLEVAVVHPSRPAEGVPPAVDRAAEHGVQRVIVQIDDLDTDATIRHLDDLVDALGTRLST
jgi:probable F420-dependent oxidoreductase